MLVFQYHILGEGGMAEVPRISSQYSIAEVDDIFSPPLTSTPKQLPTSASTHFKVPKDVSQPNNPGKEAFKTSSEDSLQKSLSCGKNVPTRCDNCGYLGTFANHLRWSNIRVQKYRDYPEFQIKGDDEEVVVKACLIINECPVPNCLSPGLPRSHHKLPTECLQWWREIGTRVMKWQGVDGSSSSSQIKAKIRNFLKNHFRRLDKSLGSQRSQEESQEPGSAESTTTPNCAFCDFSGLIAVHLQKSQLCLNHYKKTHLPRSIVYDNSNKSNFDLSLLVRPNFCPNPDCSVRGVKGGAIEHLQHPCSSFMLAEVGAVYGWNVNGSKDIAHGKLKRRQAYLMDVLRKESPLSGPMMYRQELSKVMSHICSTCLIQGPMPEDSEYKLQECIGTSPTRWQCKKCFEADGGSAHILDLSMRNVNELAGSGLTDGTLKPVMVTDSEAGTARIVFVPDCLVKNVPEEEDGLIIDPMRTTVLLPRDPDALDLIGEDVIENAFQMITNLKKWAEFVAKRIFFNHQTVSMTLLYRKKLADIKEVRLRALRSMKASSKGCIVSRKPNIGDIKDRNPHFEATKRFCLTDSCSWSDGHREQRSDESAAIASTNGQLKTEVTFEVLSLSEDCPEVRNVILTAQREYGDRIVGMLPLAPLVLQLARAKANLIMKHFVSQVYQNYDLQPKFKKTGWGVELSGVLYAEEYEMINAKIARDGASLQEIIEVVTRNPELQPTASLDPQCIADLYGIREEAEVIDIFTIFQIYETDDYIYR